MSSQISVNPVLEISPKVIISQAPDQIASELDGEAIILNMNSGIYYGLNEVGASIWDAIEQPCSVSQLLETLLAEYDVQPEVCTQELLTMLEKLEKAALIEVSNESN